MNDDYIVRSGFEDEKKRKGGKRLPGIPKLVKSEGGTSVVTPDLEKTVAEMKSMLDRDLARQA